LSLKYEGFQGPDDGHEVIRDGELLRQVRSPQVFADVVTINSQKYEVRFYSNPGALNHGLYQPHATSWISTIAVENPDAGAYNRLKVTRSTGDRVREAVYAWHEDTGEWQLESGNGLKRETLKRETQGTVQLETRQIFDPTSQLVKKTLLRVDDAPGQYRKVEEIEDPEGAKLSKVSFYDVKGRLVQVTQPDGSWEYIQYITDYKRWRVFSSYGNQVPTTSPALCRMTEYSYEPVSAPDDGSVRPFYPRCAVEYLKGQEVGRTYYVISPGEEQKIQCQTPGAAWNAPDNLTTVTRKYTDGPFADELQSIFYPDGTVELYQYEISGDNQRQTTTVSRGVPNAGRTAIVQGTKTITVIGIGADTLSRQVTDMSSGLSIDQEIHSTVDGKVRRVDYLDGTHESRTYGCCGLVETHVDRTGVETSFAYDDLDRVIATTRNGITEIQTLDPVGRILARTRQGTDGSQIVLERNTYDRAGRLVTNADVRTGPTAYAYASDGAGQRIVTATFADGGQKIETYAADGRLVKLTGSAVRPVRYGNDVEIESGVNREIRYEVRLDAAGNDTGEWVKDFRICSDATTNDNTPTAPPNPLSSMPKANYGSAKTPTVWSRCFEFMTVVYTGDTT
jgi:YD repeat-containing protein